MFVVCELVDTGKQVLTGMSLLTVTVDLKDRWCSLRPEVNAASGREA